MFGVTFTKAQGKSEESKGVFLPTRAGQYTFAIQRHVSEASFVRIWLEQSGDTYVPSSQWKANVPRVPVVVAVFNPATGKYEGHYGAPVLDRFFKEGERPAFQYRAYIPIWDVTRVITIDGEEHFPLPSGAYSVGGEPKPANKPRILDISTSRTLMDGNGNVTGKSTMADLLRTLTAAMETDIDGNVGGVLPLDRYIRLTISGEKIGKTYTFTVLTTKVNDAAMTEVCDLSALVKLTPLEAIEALVERGGSYRDVMSRYGALPAYRTTPYPPANEDLFD